MKYSLLFIRWIVCLASAVFALSCGEDQTSASGQKYGYVQFNLSKEATRAEQLDYLSLVCKIRVDLIAASGEHLSQTLNVGSKNPSTAEFGSQSDKWMLLAGDYRVNSYELFDNLDQPLLSRSYEIEDQQQIHITPGGISMHELLVNVMGRGFVRFRLTKDNAEPNPETRVNGVKKYPFHVIKSVDVKVKSQDDNKIYEFKALKVKYKVTPSDPDAEFITGTSTCDSLVSLPAGAYRVISYKTFFDNNRSSKLAEFNDEVVENSFVVTDNHTATADVPVTLDEAAAYIKDAYNLYQIWLALDGPNWSYRGTTYPKGSNWSFEGRDIDLWLAQPGVQVLETGRIAKINFDGFGAKGSMPPALGELTELRQLYLGSHSSEPGHSSSQTAALTGIPGNNVVSALDLERETEAMRTSFRETYCRNGHPLESFSEEMQEAFSLNNINYTKSKHPLRELPVNSPVNYVTEITSLDDANIGNLKNLQSLYIAFSPMTGLPDDLVKCGSLTDVEMFACPNLREFPRELADLQKLTRLTFSCNPNVPSQEMTDGLRHMNTRAIADGRKSNLQMLYIPGQLFDVLPDLSNLKKMGLLSIQSCKVKTIEKAFGESHYFYQFLANDNQISSLPVDDKGYFVGLHGDWEVMTFANNQFTELPNIFDGSSTYRLKQVDFAGNKISTMQGTADGTWKGVNVEILSLGFNKFTEFPRQIFTNDEHCSKIAYLQLQGNGIEKFVPEALEGMHERVVRLVSLDLSMNKLTELPKNFNAVTLPYLIGLDLSYNRFESFQFKPLDCPSLSTYIFRGQRDAKGNRCMKQWPDGISKHRGMRTLFLGSNDIRKVDESLSYLIFNLEIIDNPNITIDVSSVCAYIKANRFRLAYDADQDIRGCEDLNLNK